MLAIADLAAENTRATLSHNTGILACQTGLILAGAEPTFRLLRWLALRGSPPGSLARPVMRLLGPPFSQGADLIRRRWRSGPVEQRYRSQVGQHLSEHNETT